MALGIQEGTNFFPIAPSKASTALREGPITRIFLEIGNLLNFKILLVVCFLKGCVKETIKTRYLYNIINTETLDGYAVNMNEKINWMSVLLNIECT